MGNIYKDYTPPSNGGGQYLKFEDAKPVRLRIVSEPVIFDSTFQKGEEMSISTKYSWIVWNLDENVAQVMTLPSSAYKLIANYGADEDWGDPLTNPYNLKITRRGTGLETEYSIVASVAKDELTSEQETEIKGINLISAVESSPSASRVQWLRDVISSGRTTSTAKKKDDVSIDIPSEPINLDDIPF